MTNGVTTRMARTTGGVTTQERVAAWTTDGVVTGACGVWMTRGVTCVHDQWRDNPNGVDDRRRDDPRVAWTTDGVTTGVRGVWTTGGVT